MILKKYFVNGMHCAACELVVEKKLSKRAELKNVKANLKNSTVIFEIEREISDSELLSNLNSALNETGYNVSTVKETKKVNVKNLFFAFCIASLFMVLFLSLQKLGLVNFLNSSDVSLPFVFLIGVVASLSSCMAVVGGLVLSISASFANSKNKNKTLMFFHLSRIVSFFILGGIVGLIGSVFTLTRQTSFIMSLILFVLMILMGINLLGIYDTFKNKQLKIPKIKFISNLESNLKTNTFTPLLLGLSTFFLPCGFTQSMQFYSLSTGNFLKGALIMLVFSIGTLPVLASISLISVKLSGAKKSDVFFKTAGFITILFAIFNILGALNSIGFTKFQLDF